MSQQFHLAQLNIADAKAPLESEIMHGFVSRLDEIHLLSDNAEGFIWRHQSEEGEDIGERIFAVPSLVVNLTLWEDIATLRHFVYNTAHKEMIQNRRDWFDKMPETQQVLWWVPAGHTPSVQEAKDKLDLIRDIGPSAEAFSFAKPFDPNV